MQSLPDWVKAIKDKKELTSVIQTHIKTVVGRYKGRIRAWVSVRLGVLSPMPQQHLLLFPRRCRLTLELDLNKRTSSTRSSPIMALSGRRSSTMCWGRTSCASPSRPRMLQTRTRCSTTTTTTWIDRTMRSCLSASCPMLRSGFRPAFLFTASVRPGRSPASYPLYSSYPPAGICRSRNHDRAILLMHASHTGSQCHLGEGGANNLKAALDALAGTGVKEVAITELDIAKAGSDDYWRAADACMKVSKCVGITTWGVGDVVRNPPCPPSPSQEDEILQPQPTASSESRRTNSLGRHRNPGGGLKSLSSSTRIGRPSPRTTPLRTPSSDRRPEAV